jgi:hypothetical protein
MLSTLLLSTSLLTAPAQAGRCDNYIRRADSSSGAALIQNFNSLARCDAQLAEDNFTRFMTRATDADTLSALSLAAIQADVWNPIWMMPGKIRSYEARDIVTNKIGEACAENEKVVTFLQGAYAGIREVDFARWEDALVACESESFDGWLTDQITAPPARAFDGKFDTLLKAFIKRSDGAAALPDLQAGAIAAAGNGGPYDAMIDAMNKAVSPSLGGQISETDQIDLSAALINIANQVPADKARKIAETLSMSGDEANAASLLPVVYSDRVQADGGYMYGVAAIEAGECKGTQTAMIHFAELSEPGQRWVIPEDSAAGILASKPRLKKCTAEGDWQVRISAEPLTNSAAVDDWVISIAAEWSGRGYEVNTRSEKGISAE